MRSECEDTGRENTPKSGKRRLVWLLLILPLAMLLSRCAGFDTLDVSEIPGSLLFCGTASVFGLESYGIGKLDIAAGTVETVFRRDESLPRRVTIDDFVYAPDSDTFVIRTQDRSESPYPDDAEYVAFAADGNGDYREGLVLDYSTRLFEHFPMSYAEQPEKLVVVKHDGLDFLDIETGELESRLDLNLAALEGQRDVGMSYADWNEDFTRLLACDVHTLRLYDTESGAWSECLTDRNRIYDPLFAEGYGEIVFSVQGRYVWKYNIETGKTSKLCDLGDLTKDISSLVMSPDRRYAAVYCEKRGFLGPVKQYIVIVEVSTGRRAVVRSQQWKSSIGKMQWIE
jgi:hypothetical protein